MQEFRDRCHIDINAGITERMTPEEKSEVLNWAFDEFMKVNRRSLLSNIMQRPGFYWALAHDMAFFKHPKYFFGYLKDFFAGTAE